MTGFHARTGRRLSDWIAMLAQAWWLSPLLGLVAIALLLALLRRRPSDPRAGIEELARLLAARNAQDREAREEAADRARADRAELADATARMSRLLAQQMASFADSQHGQIDRFSERLAQIADSNDKRLAEIRETLERQLAALTRDNAARLEQMRETVDEKLQSTLQRRLGETFDMVAARLEQVHKGMGEMNALAADVGDLRRVLANVRTRGTWGEIQLGALLEQILVPDQYARNVEVVAGSGERVEFAMRLPGHDPASPVWLPIDAKFPREDYERLGAARDEGDAAAAAGAERQLDARLRQEAKTIRSKYVAPPATTDFALLFLPTEGLYAEAVRRPGLLDDLQRTHRVVVAGPSTLAAILSSLQMGFRTLAIEQRSSEVWELLGAVKSEFGRFGDALAKTREQIERAASTIGSAETRSRAIERRLRKVESLPDADSRRHLDDEDSAQGRSEDPG
jgi:DNA recombination protein RmuC